MIGKCDVCGREGHVHVMASTMGPISYAYCEECLKNGLEPYDDMVSYIACAGRFPDDINEAYQEIVRKNLSFFNIKEEQFIKDVDAAIKCIDNYFSECCSKEEL